MTGYDVVGWNGILLPAATPDGVALRIEGVLLKMLEDPSVGEQIRQSASEVVANVDGKQLARTIKSDIMRIARSVASKGLKLD